MNFFFRRFLLLVILITILGNSYSQSPSVNPLTGRLNMGVPLYGLTLDGKNFPIGLSYSTGGMRVGDTGGLVGVSWNFIGEGKISRIVKDLPDDHSSYDAFSDVTKIGWLRGTVAQDISSLVTGKANCTQENNTWSALNGYKYKDTRTDEYIISFGDISAKFVFDENQVPRFTTYKDIDLTYHTDATSGEITSFTVKDNQGYEYLFDEVSRADKKISIEMDTIHHKINYYHPGPISQMIKVQDFDAWANSLPGFRSDIITVKDTIKNTGEVNQYYVKSATLVQIDSINYTGYVFDRERNLYGEKVAYTTSWHLTKITAPSGRHIKYKYTDQKYSDEADVLTEKSLPVQLKYNRTYYTKTNSIGNDSYGRRIAHKVSENTYNIYLKEISVYDNLAANEQWTTQVTFDLSQYKIFDRFKSTKPSKLAFNKRKNHRINAIKVTTDIGLGQEIVKQYKFNYNGNYSISGMLFLKSIEEIVDCNVLPPISFRYYHQEDPAIKVYPSETDAFGYFNNDNRHEDAATNHTYLQDLPPKLYIYPDKTPKYQYALHKDTGYGGTEIELSGYNLYNSTYVNYGALQDITFGDGGMTRIQYEPNEYYDTDFAETLYGGGIRVKGIYTSEKENFYNPDGSLITDFTTGADGIKTSYVTYDYSGGKLINKPFYAYRTNHHIGNGVDILDYSELSQSPYTTSHLWKYLTIRTNENLNENGSYILYGSVKRIIPEQGYITYDYNIPVHFDIDNFNNYDYEASTVNFYRSAASGCESLGILAENVDNVFPYVQNPSYDIENGLNSTVTTFSELNEPLSKTSTTYQRLNDTNFKKVYGYYVGRLPAEDYNSDYIIPFSKYYYITQVASAPNTITTTTYDQNDVTLFTESLQTYRYEGENPGLLSSTIIESQNQERKTSYQYPQDFATATADVTGYAGSTIAYFNTHNIHTPVISSTQSIIENSSETITGSVLREYKQDNTSIYMSRSWVLKEAISPANVATPSVNGSGEVTYDALYQETGTTAEILHGKVVSNKDVFNNYSGVHIGYTDKLPVMNLTNCKASEVIYSGFEVETIHSFTDSNTPLSDYTTNGSHTGYGYTEMTNSSTLTSGYTRNGKLKFLLSVWGKSATSGTLTLTLSDVSAHSQSYVINYLDTNDEYKYHMLPVDLTNVSMDDVMTITITSDQDISLDDIIFKPADALVQYHTYSSKGLPLSTTDNAGQTIYREYDQRNRIIKIKDNDKNILKLYNYNSINSHQLLDADFDIVGSIQKDVSVTFKSNQSCITPADLTYLWKFNNGEDVNSSEETTFTFAEAGFYPVSLTITHPTYGQDEVIRYVQVFEDGGYELDPALPPVIITAAGMKQNSCNPLASTDSFDTNDRISNNYEMPDNPNDPNDPPGIRTKTAFQSYFNYSEGDLSSGYSIIWQYYDYGWHTLTTPIESTELVFDFTTLHNARVTKVRCILYQSTEDDLTVLSFKTKPLVSNTITLDIEHCN